VCGRELSSFCSHVVRRRLMPSSTSPSRIQRWGSAPRCRTRSLLAGQGLASRTRCQPNLAQPQARTRMVTRGRALTPIRASTSTLATINVLYSVLGRRFFLIAEKTSGAKNNPSSSEPAKNPIATPVTPCSAPPAAAKPTSSVDPTVVRNAA
jgi:hypothetical protein